MNVALDTHRIVKRLMEAGFSDVQAETVTEMKADKVDMLKWGTGILFVQGGVLLTLIRLFVGGH